MQTQTLLLIIGAAILALGVAVFQYYYKATFKTSRNKIYAVLRFLTVFGLLLLLINPRYKQVKYYTEKPSLAIALDDSESIKFLAYGEEVQNAAERFRESEQLNNAFDLQFYKFGSRVTELDSLSFDQKQTDLSAVLTSMSDIYNNDIAPLVLVTDGNQTFGEAFQYTSKNYKQQVYPLVAGDTITYDDLRLGQVNVNRYAYINNKFPVEIFASYVGDASVNSKLTVQSGGRTLYSKNVSFSTSNASQVFNVLLPADAVGVRQFTIGLSPVTEEKNKKNNYKNFAIEVIDQKTNVLVISSILHPDLGMLKKSIEGNRLRTVTFAKPAESISRMNDFELIILYQPNGLFRKVYERLESLGKNSITITGPKTDWNTLNSIQRVLTQEITGQKENVQGALNPNFSAFVIEDIGFSNFPPLEVPFGDVVFNVENDIALYQRIGSVVTDIPLLATTDSDGRRGVYILGEGLWKWRSQSFLDKRSFEDFDNFIDNLVQYAASTKKKSRLNLEYESFYYGNSEIKLYAQYFDKNYVFDDRASLEINIVNKETKRQTVVPMLLRRNTYTVNLNNIEAGTYDFTVTVKDQGLARSGTFTIVPFEMEQQFLNADVTPLREVASNTNGKLFSINNVDALINMLLEDNRYRPVQKSTENIVPLIDWRWLLGLLALLLTIEWFMRKYNGLT